MFKPLSPQVFPDEGTGPKGGSENVDSVYLSPESDAFLDRGVGEHAAVGDVMDRQFRVSILRCHREKVAPTSMCGGLDIDPVF